MSHEISFNTITGKAEAAYADQAAWHNLGEVVTGDLSSDNMKRQAALGWTVSKRPIRLVEDDRPAITDSFALVRDDTHDTLAVVGNDYKIFQNDESFEFVDSLLQDGVIEYESAFALKGGRQVVLLARMPSVDHTMPGDSTKRYIAFHNSHGFGTIRTFATAVREVCANTVAIGEAQAFRDARDKILGGMFTVRHSGSLTVKLNAARVYLSQLDKQFTLYNEQTKALLTGYTPEQAKEYIATLFPAPTELDGSKRASTVYADRIEQLQKAFKHRTNTLAGMDGTFWQLFNTVTYYVDHGTPARQSRKQRDRDENRYISVITGVGASLKDTALRLALEMSGNAKMITPKLEADNLTLAV